MGILMRKAITVISHQIFLENKENLDITSMELHKGITKVDFFLLRSIMETSSGNDPNKV